MDKAYSYKKIIRKNKESQEAIVVVHTRFRRSPKSKKKSLNQAARVGAGNISQTTGASTVHLPPNAVVTGTNITAKVSKQAKGVINKTSYRVHGAGNYVMITEEGNHLGAPKRYPATETRIHEILNSGEVVLVDTGHLSRVQLGSVLGTINAKDESVDFETVVRSGRTMITAKKKEKMG